MIACATYEQQTQHQLIVWIGPTTGEVPIEDWANRAFENGEWGAKASMTGSLSSSWRAIAAFASRWATDLRAQVPDLLAKRIIDNTIVPRIRSGDNAGAIEAGLEALTQAIGQPLPGQSRRGPHRAAGHGR